LFIETFGFNALVAKIITTIFVVLFSYFSQKYFTFKPADNLLNIEKNNFISTENS
jgi:putative flippase GtrA